MYLAFLSWKRQRSVSNKLVGNKRFDSSREPISGSQTLPVPRGTLPGSADVMTSHRPGGAAPSLAALAWWRHTAQVARAEARRVDPVLLHNQPFPHSGHQLGTSPSCDCSPQVWLWASNLPFSMVTQHLLPFFLAASPTALPCLLVPPNPWDYLSLSLGGLFTLQIHLRLLLIPWIWKKNMWCTQKFYKWNDDAWIFFY